MLSSFKYRYAAKIVVADLVRDYKHSSPRASRIGFVVLPNKSIAKEMPDMEWFTLR